MSMDFITSLDCNLENAKKCTNLEEAQTVFVPLSIALKFAVYVVKWSKPPMKTYMCSFP